METLDPEDEKQQTVEINNVYDPEDEKSMLDILDIVRIETEEDKKAIARLIYSENQDIYDIYDFFENEFTWDLNFFTKLENLVIKLSYYQNTTFKLKHVKECLEYKIKNSLIWDFNYFLKNELKTNTIENHWELVEIENITNGYNYSLAEGTTNEAVFYMFKNKKFFEKTEKDRWTDLYRTKMIENLFKNRHYKILKKLYDILCLKNNDDYFHVKDLYNFVIEDNEYKNSDILYKINEKIIDILINKKSKNWDYFVSNPSDKAIEFMLKPENQDKIKWDYFASNPNDKAVDFLLNPENQDIIQSRYWYYRSSLNPNNKIVEFLLKPENQDKINWLWFSKNPNDIAVEFLLKPENQDKIEWLWFSRNPNDKAAEFMTKPENQDKIDCYWFSRNPSDKAAEFMTKPENQHKIDWFWFSRNPSRKAIEFMLKPENQDKINPPNTESIIRNYCNINTYDIKKYYDKNKKIKNDHEKDLIISKYNYYNEKIMKIKNTFPRMMNILNAITRK